MCDYDRQLEEWRVSMDNARHFNDLLMRLRMLGMPMVVTMAVAGVACVNFQRTIEIWKWFLPMSSLFLAVVYSVGLWGYVRHKRRQVQPELRQRATNCTQGQRRLELRECLGSTVWSC